MIRYIKNEDGPLIGYSASSGISILTVEGKKFKDLLEECDGR